MQEDVFLAKAWPGLNKWHFDSLKMRLFRDDGTDQTERVAGVMSSVPLISTTPRY